MEEPCLLWSEKQARILGPDPNFELIGRDELGRIRQIWRTEESDWEDSLPAIYKKIYDDVYWTADDNNPFNRYDKQLLSSLAEKYEVPVRLTPKLIDLELQTQGMSIRHSIYKRIDNIFNEEWRTLAEIKEELSISE